MYVKLAITGTFKWTIFVLRLINLPTFLKHPVLSRKTSALNFISVELCKYCFLSWQWLHIAYILRCLETFFRLQHKRYGKKKIKKIKFTLLKLCPLNSFFLHAKAKQNHSFSVYHCLFWRIDFQYSPELWLLFLLKVYELWNSIICFRYTNAACRKMFEKVVVKKSSEGNLDNVQLSYNITPLLHHPPFGMVQITLFQKEVHVDVQC